MAGQSKTHLCVASSIRALVENEMPDKYFMIKKGKVLQKKNMI